MFLMGNPWGLICELLSAPLPRAPLELRASLTVRASQQLRASQSLRAPVVLSGWEKVPFGAFIGR